MDAGAKQDLLDKIARRRAQVGVIGLGYVGLPLAAVLAEAGFRVIGVDIDERKVRQVNAGASYVEDIDEARLGPLVRDGRLRATCDYSALDACDAVSICVPTPLRKTRSPDVSYILNATEAITRHLHPGMLVVLESTTYPGTTTEVILPRFERDAAHLTVGEDLFLCFSPERVDPGRKDWTTRNTPKVMGGVTEACLEVGMALYGAAIETIVPVSSTEAAEMTKLLENTFRAVNIGLANEVLLICDKLGLNAWEVIEAAATKPFGFMKFTPGPGLGGHCIPVDPQYLSWKLRTLNYTARFIELATEVNAAMPAYWVRKAQDALNAVGKPIQDSRILILGVSYKRDVSDLRESPALDIVTLLHDKGGRVSYHDPHVPAFAHMGLEMISVDDLEAAVAEADCVLIAADHSDYDWAAIHAKARLVVDTRATLLKKSAGPKSPLPRYEEDGDASGKVQPAQ